ncbi:MAG: hypothetical protein N2651_00315 [Fimbriimonadales bacterium]|nr:hypothetical protein [Fimbriimonadales bacterium]
MTPLMVLGTRLMAQMARIFGSLQSLALVVPTRSQSVSLAQRLTRGLTLALATTLVTLSNNAIAQQPCLNADVNGDGVVDDADLLQVLFCFGTNVRWTVPELNNLLAERLPSAFPRRFPAALDVPFEPDNAAFARTRIRGMESFFDVFIAWDTRADFRNFPPPQIAQGLVVGAVYLPQGEAPTGQLLQEGFYLVQLRSSDLQQWSMILRNAQTNAIAAVFPANVQVIEPFNAPRTWNDVAIRIIRRPGGGFCVEIWLTYMCPNGTLLDSTLVWRRCF